MRRQSARGGREIASAPSGRRLRVQQGGRVTPATAGKLAWPCARTRNMVTQQRVTMPPGNSALTVEQKSKHTDRNGGGERWAFP